MRSADRLGAAIAGVGESLYFKRGESPDSEAKLCLTAILAALGDAGVPASAVDGLVSFGFEANDPHRVANAIGVDELRFSALAWGGGGGGGCGAVGLAAAAVMTGQAENVIVYRALAQGETGRYGQRFHVPVVSGDLAFSLPYGMVSPAQLFAMRVMRFMHDHGVSHDALRAVSLASYHHANANPRAVMRGKNLTPDEYDSSRWIVEPFRLFDCCMENDGAAAVLVTSAERARELHDQPAYILGVAQGSDRRQFVSAHNDAEYASAGFKGIARRLYDTTGTAPSDVDVVQCYSHFTGGVVMALTEFGFFAPEEADDFLRFENLIAPSGRLPLNTSGGDIAECYVHGMGLIVEAARQIRGESPNQVADVSLSLALSAPMTAPTSALLLSAGQPR